MLLPKQYNINVSVYSPNNFSLASFYIKFSLKEPLELHFNPYIRVYYNKLINMYYC